MEITEKWLVENHACSDGLAAAVGVIGGGMSVEDLLPKFERADWLIWLLHHAGVVDHRQIVRLACLCARQALPYVPPGEARPRLAIEAAERWIESPTGENRDAAGAAAGAAAWAAAGAAAGAAARDAEQSWQRDRLVAWFSDNEPTDWPITQAVPAEKAA